MDRCDQVVFARELRATELSKDTDLHSHAEECFWSVFLVSRLGKHIFSTRLRIFAFPLRSEISGSFGRKNAS